MPKDAKTKLQEYFRDKRVIIAFSGGLDSTVLLEIAKGVARTVLPVIVKSALVSAKEIKFAIDYLTERKIRYKILNVNPLEHPEITQNNPRRCYYCKQLIFKSIIEEVSSRDYDMIVEGSNITDLDDYRPGMEALKEFGIKSPYLELHITKSKIKEIAAEMGLVVSKKPSSTCLATRIPYGKQLDQSILSNIEKAEEIIKRIFSTSTLRLRVHENIARIEVPINEIANFIENDKREELIIELKKIGFTYITLDLEGYRQGSMNLLLENEKVLNNE